MIIGFTGKAGSGKDTSTEILNGFKKMAFADPLKEASKILFNFTDEQLYDTFKKEEIDERWNKSPRQIFQWLGTDILRNGVNQDFFIMNMKQRIQMLRSVNSNVNIAITDVRFDNEAELIKKLGGIIIKIVRNDTKNIGTIHSSHITEQGISDRYIDHIVENNGTKQELYHKITDILIMRS